MLDYLAFSYYVTLYLVVCDVCPVVPCLCWTFTCDKLSLILRSRKPWLQKTFLLPLVLTHVKRNSVRTPWYATEKKCSDIVWSLCWHKKKKKMSGIKGRITGWWLPSPDMQANEVAQQPSGAAVADDRLGSPETDEWCWPRLFGRVFVIHIMRALDILNEIFCVIGVEIRTATGWI